MKKPSEWALAVCLCLASPTVLEAANLISHAGSTDPVIEGWNINAVLPGDVSTGPVTGDGASALDAWFTDDNGSASNVSYAYSLTGQDLADMTMGWRYSVLLRVVDVPDPIDFGVSLQIEDGSSVWGLIFGSDANANTLWTTFDGSPIQQITAGTTDYHLFELVEEDRQTNGIDVYVDGQLIFSDYVGSASNRALVAFGDTSSTAGSGGLAHFAEVRLTAVPIPAAAWLFSSGLLGLIGIARKRTA
jgi:hypothetical protein